MNTSRNAYHLAPIRRVALNPGEWRRLAVICVLSILVATLSLARAANSQAPAANQQHVTSTFVNKNGFGKDPFFPKSTRRGPVQVIPVTDVTPVGAGSLSLKGISGPKNHRLAIINNRTFEAGEEADLKSFGGILKVKCVEIRDDGVVVIVNGQTQRLNLPVK